jgi:hypothetical protein
MSHIDGVKEVGRALNTVRTGDEFKDIFMEISSSRNVEDDDPYISMIDVPTVVKGVLGDTIAQFIIEKFMIMCKRAEVGGRVYWTDFMNIVPRALVAAQADCSLKRELPPLVMLMTKPRIKDPDMGPVRTSKSSYTDTFCVSFKDIIADNKTEIPHSMLNPAAKGLAVGSSKGTNQIPGYSGHMPLNTSNPRKYEHSHGDYLHPVVNSLRMTKKGGANVLGYAAHLPWHADSDGERLCGCDPRTSTGAAFGETRLML